MPDKLFDIPSPPSNAIVLDKNRKGVVQYTVTNISGRPLRRTDARPVPLPDQSAPYSAWLTLDPAGYREYGIAGVQQYTIQIEAPDTAAPGSYTFALSVWDDANPDDTLMTGPSVTITLAQPAVKKPAPFPWWIPVVVVAVIVLIVGAIVISQGSGGTTVTPTPPITPGGATTLWRAPLTMKGGNNTSYVLRITRPGRIEVAAKLANATDSVEFQILTGAGNAVAKGQLSGGVFTPALLDITDADVRNSDTWMVSIRTTGANTSAKGVVLIKYPGATGAGENVEDPFNVTPQEADLIFVIAATREGTVAARTSGAPSNAVFTLTRFGGNTAGLIRPNNGDGAFSYTVTDVAKDHPLFFGIHAGTPPNAQNGVVEMRFP